MTPSKTSRAQKPSWSRSKAVGLLPLEAKKLHPKVKDFEAFLDKVNGLQRSRAYDLLRLAGGRATDEELKRELGSGSNVNANVTGSYRSRPRRLISVTSRKLYLRRRSSTPTPVPMLCGQVRHRRYRREAVARREGGYAVGQESRRVSGRLQNLLAPSNRGRSEKARVYFMEGSWKPRRREAGNGKP